LKLAKLGAGLKKFWPWFKGLKWYKWIVVAVIILVGLSFAMGQANKAKGQLVTGVMTEKVQNRWV